MLTTFNQDWLRLLSAQGVPKDGQASINASYIFPVLAAAINAF